MQIQFMSERFFNAMRGGQTGEKAIKDSRPSREPGRKWVDYVSNFFKCLFTVNQGL